MRRNLRAWSRGFACLAACSVLLASCTSGSSSGPPTSSNSPIILDLNGPLSDPFFGSVKQGSDAAAKSFGINYQYIAPANLSNFVPDYTALIREALARHPAALVVGNYVPSAFDPLIKQATSSGIPVVIMNTGLASWQSDGAITFVGQDTISTGAIAGSEALVKGVHHLLCVNGAPVNPTLGALCNAAKQKMEAAGGTLMELDIRTADASNPS